MVQKLLICIIHTVKLQLREPTLRKTLQNISGMTNWDVSIEFINQYDPDVLQSTQKLAEIIKLEGPGDGSIYDKLIKPLHIKQVSQALKHKQALEIFKQNSKYDVLLILENDALSSPNVQNDLQNALTHFLRANIPFLSLGCPVPKAATGNMANIVEFFRFLPTTDSYLVSRQHVTTFVDNFLPLRYSINVQLSYICHKEKMKMELFNPNVFVNGSKFGVFLSSVDPNNRLFMNNEYNTVVTLLANENLSDADKQTIEKIHNTIPFKEHPDFIHQFANYYMKIKDYTKAKEYFEKAYKIFKENDCILNSESEFLINYSRIFQHFQDLEEPISIS
jgi:tetratricopeptide (TPR) repeat protein